MTKGVRTIIYPVTDIAQAKKLYISLLGVKPIMDEAYYVGFKVGDQDIGLDPNGHNQGMTGPVGYHHVNDIKKSLQLLLDAGAQLRQEVKDVGGGKLIAAAMAWGAPAGLQMMLRLDQSGDRLLPVSRGARRSAAPEKPARGGCRCLRTSDHPVRQQRRAFLSSAAA